MPPPVRTSARYVLTAPGGARAVFNDPADPDYVAGFEGEDAITGLDSAEIIESSEDLVEADGAVHGAFFRGRRPVTFKGKIVPTGWDDSAAKQGRLLRATTALRRLHPNDTTNGDGELRWNLGVAAYPDDMFIKVRTQQPTRLRGGFVKDFQAALVAADPRIYSALLRTASVTAGAATAAGRVYDRSYDVMYDWGSTVGTLNLTNNGDVSAPALLRVYGPGTNPAVQNVTTGEEITLACTLTSSQWVKINTATGEVLLETSTTSQPFDSAVQLERTRWWGLQPGTNQIGLVYLSNGAGAKLDVEWRDTWA